MFNHKKKLLIGLTLISLSTASFAFGPKWGDNHQPGARIAHELNLTAEQQEKMMEIMQTQKKEARAWREKHSEQTEEKMAQVLTTKQFDKFKAFKQHAEFHKGMQRDMGRKSPRRFAQGMQQNEHYPRACREEMRPF